MNVYSKDKSKETPLSIYYAYLKFKWFKGRWKTPQEQVFIVTSEFFVNVARGGKRWEKGKEPNLC